MKKITLAIFLLCAACADNANTTANQPGVHGSDFIYDPKAKAIESVAFVYDPGAPPVHASQFIVTQNP